MKKLLHFEFIRLIRSKVAALVFVLIFVIAAFGIVFNHICHSGDSPMSNMIVIYNSYTHFIYLVLSLVFIITFTKDYKKGVNDFYVQQGYNMVDFYISKFILLVFFNLPIIDVIFIATNFFYNNSNIMFLAEMIMIVNLSTVFVVLMTMAISMLTKNTVRAILIFYGLFALFNIGNLFLFGVFNPADWNSISSYLLNLMSDPNTTHYSLGDINLGSVRHQSVICVVVPLIDSLMMFLIDVLILNKKSIDCQTKKYRINVVKLLR